MATKSTTDTQVNKYDKTCFEKNIKFNTKASIHYNEMPPQAYMPQKHDAAITVASQAVLSPSTRDRGMRPHTL